jgi:hypothetical protein
MQKLLCFSALTAVAQDLSGDPLIFVAQEWPSKFFRAGDHCSGLARLFRL